MAWYHDAVFYHIYPLGLTGAPKQNGYCAAQQRFDELTAWLPHIQSIGCNAIYIGPLFESVGHGYETTDYKKADSRLGTNNDLRQFVAECHSRGIRVVLDGVFNHTGRDFFAFRDLKEKRENSPYRDWYCGVNFWGNNSYNDGFSYENWGGYDLLVKLNQRNSEVIEYICGVISFWVSEFDIDGIRLDAADVLDFDYMKALRRTANAVKSDFWLMGEVIHGDYSRWVGSDVLHSVTNYMLHKALYSAHNDHNYFELAHTLKYVQDRVGPDAALYNFADNHDVERITTRLCNKAHFTPVHILLYTLPGIASIYYGSEFGIEGRKEHWSDDSLRPALRIDDYRDAITTNPRTALIAALGKLRGNTPALRRGIYRELHLQTEVYAFARELDGVCVIVAVNNAGHEKQLTLSVNGDGEYVGVLWGSRTRACGGSLTVTVGADSGEIWLPAALSEQAALPPVIAEIRPEPLCSATPAPVQAPEQSLKPVRTPPSVEQPAAPSEPPVNKPFEEMTIEELQEQILACMRKNGPVTDYMRQTVRENTHHGSLLNWVRSFQ